MSSCRLTLHVIKIFYRRRRQRRQEEKRPLIQKDQECRQREEKHPGNCFGIKLHNNKKGKTHDEGEVEITNSPQQSISNFVYIV